MQIHVYLNFDGQTEEAMAFYAGALGATNTGLHRFGEMPAEGFELTAEQKHRVMHTAIALPSGATIMASDTLPGMGPERVVGTHATISLHPSSREEADRVFASLSEGGAVTVPLADTFWGAYYGALTDRYGVQWMLNLEQRS